MILIYRMIFLKQYNAKAPDLLPQINIAVIILALYILEMKDWEITAQTRKILIILRHSV